MLHLNESVSKFHVRFLLYGSFVTLQQKNRVLANLDCNCIPCLVINKIVGTMKNLKYFTCMCVNSFVIDHVYTVIQSIRDPT